MNVNSKFLTEEEKSARDYFHGKGIYKKYQDFKTPPNIFDTRQSLIKKMKDKNVLKKYLETYNRRYPIE